MAAQCNDGAEYAFLQFGHPSIPGRPPSVARARGCVMERTQVVHIFSYDLKTESDYVSLFGEQRSATERR